MALQIAPRKIPNPQAYQALHAVSVQRDLSDLVSCDSLPTPFAHLYPLISLLFLEYAALEPAQVLCLLPEMLFFRCSLVPPPLSSLGLCSNVTFSGDPPWQPYFIFVTLSIYLPSLIFFFGSTCYILICILLIYSLLSFQGPFFLVYVF